MPGINDDPKQVEEIIEIAEAAGATFIGGISLHLRPGVKEVFMDCCGPPARTWSSVTSACTRAAPISIPMTSAGRGASARTRTDQAQPLVRRRPFARRDPG